MAYPAVFTFCPHCACRLSEAELEGAIRKQCPECGWIHYRNPTVGVAVVLIEQGRLLIGQRLSGGWCIPCGHVEWDEPVEHAAVREFQEETGLTVKLDGIAAVKSNFHREDTRTVGVWYHGTRIEGALQAGSDLLDVQFAPFEDLPDLIFPTDREVVAVIRREFS